MKHDSKTFFIENIRAKYNYIILKNKIKEINGQYYFEFDIFDILKNYDPEKMSCQCHQPSDFDVDQLRIFARESFFRIKDYLKNSPELFL